MIHDVAKICKNHPSIRILWSHLKSRNANEQHLNNLQKAPRTSSECPDVHLCIQEQLPNDPFDIPRSLPNKRGDQSDRRHLLNTVELFQTLPTQPTKKDGNRNMNPPSKSPVSSEREWVIVGKGPLAPVGDSLSHLVTTVRNVSPFVWRNPRMVQTHPQIPQQKVGAKGFKVWLDV